MNIVVLDAVTLGEDIDLSILNELGDVIIYRNSKREQVTDRLKHADVAITNKVPLNGEMMKELPNLKLICIAATGMDIIDLEAANNYSIAVKNVEAYSSTSVAQHVFAMVLNLIQNLKFYHDVATSSNWEQSGIFTCLERPFWELAGKRWGIIGLGNIGKEVAKRAQAFACDVVYHSVSGTPQEVDFPMLSLNQLLESSDVISVHCPLTNKTKNLLNAQNLHLIQDHAILVNVARGAVINSEDLVSVKKIKKFKVALDVFDEEPLKEGHILNELRHRDDILFTPHIGWGSIEARQRLVRAIANNIKASTRY